MSALADITSPETQKVMGRPPVASALTFKNLTEPGKGLAQGDTVEAVYTYTDPDTDLEDPDKTRWQWLTRDGVLINGATGKTLLTTSEHNKQFLSFQVTPGSMEPADPDMATAPVVSDYANAMIVLPPRAQLASEYILSPDPMNWGDAYMHCAALGERLPKEAELQTLFTTYTRANSVGEDSKLDISHTYDWPIGSYVYWAAEGGDGHHQYVYLLSDGHASGNASGNRYWFACATSGQTEGLPTVTGVSVPNASPGVPVTVAYTYNGNATIPDRSRFQWYTTTSADGAGKILIAGATNKTYTPSASDVGKLLAVEVTPASYDTVVGPMATAVSATVVAGPPAVSNVRISGYDQWGTPQIGGTLKGEYDFNANGGTADASTYRWLNGSKSSTSRTYTLTEADVGKTLTFEVTAKSSSGIGGNTASANANKRVSIFKRFIKPDNQKYPRINPPLVPGGDPAEMECTFNGARLPTRNELTALFKDETSGGTNTELCSKYDWPMPPHCGGSGNESRYWTSEKTSAGQEAYHVNLTNGVVSKTYIGNAFFVACINR